MLVIQTLKIIQQTNFVIQTVAVAMLVAVSIKDIEEDNVEIEKSVRALSKDGNCRNISIWLNSCRWISTNWYWYSKTNEKKENKNNTNAWNYRRNMCLLVFYFLVLSVAFLLWHRTGFYQTRNVEKPFLLKPR